MTVAPKTFLALAVLAAVPLLTACEGDLSAPSRPRTGGILSPDATESDRAWQREIEQPKRQLPTGGGGEFPGQSKAAPGRGEGGSDQARVVTASNVPFGRHPGGNLVPPEGTSARLPEMRFGEVSWYRGPLPEVKPVSEPTAGSTPVPLTGWAVEHSWGEVRPLENYPHRDWSAMQTRYVAAVVKHNPTYFSPIQNQLPVVQNDGSWGGNAMSSLWEVPWFGLQVGALPVTMVIDPALSQVTTQRLGRDPLYLGHLPVGGPIVASPTPGVVRWEYPFLQAGSGGGRTTTAPATQPIAPTPGIVIPLEDAPGGVPGEAGAGEGATTPGLR